ncbi:N2227-like protein-domain-containing protein [Limtongia smithiae]|uniref:N2227-like protein-domain-containing protein n=1 Tax=Limtongia smithiae TaxID=1125753 RepID=UPI0034CE080A
MDVNLNYENGADEAPLDESILEQRALTSTLNSFLVYCKAGRYNLTESRRRAYQNLSDRHRSLLSSFYTDHLNAVDNALNANAEFLNMVVTIAANEFEAPQDKSEWDGATGIQVEHVKSTIKQIFRDWSREGAPERAVCYGPVIEALNGLFSSDIRRSKRVLVPGAGLGRLAYDIACEGYFSQGNEFSYHMLVMSNFLLNHTTTTSEYTIYPFVHNFSHTSRGANQVRPIVIPDVCPSTHDISTTENFSFCAGSFTDVYGRKEMLDDEVEEKWDAIATVFFIDTAHNVLDYIDTISYALSEDSTSYWINFGPLLYHFEDQQSEATLNGPSDVENLSIELPLDKLVQVIEDSGFVFEALRTGIKTTYAADDRALGRWVYDSVFWVARKRRPGEEFTSFVDEIPTR